MKMKIGVATLILLLMVGLIGCAAYEAITGQTAPTKENMSGNSGLNLSFLQNVSIGWQFLLVAGSLGIAIWLLLCRSDCP
jgi:hypothetical protein